MLAIRLEGTPWGCSVHRHERRGGKWQCNPTRVLSKKQKKTMYSQHDVFIPFLTSAVNRRFVVHRIVVAALIACLVAFSGARGSRKEKSTPRVGEAGGDESLQ